MNTLGKFTGAFRAKASNFRQVTTEDGKEQGVLDAVVAVFNEPDTEVAVGNEVRQVIDPGAFRTWIEATDFDSNPVQFYRDHGDAHITGYVNYDLLLGWADGFRETDEGLATTLHYFLDTPEGLTAWNKARAKPEMVQFSFRWPEDVTQKGDDGFEHVTEFTGVDEVSQVGFGAQQLTHVLAGSARTAAKARQPEGDALREHLAADAPDGHGLTVADDASDEDNETRHVSEHEDGNAEHSHEGITNGGEGERSLGARQLVALDRITNAIRQAWWDSHPVESLAEFSYVEEVYAEADMGSGHVIVFESNIEGWRQIPWSAEGDSYAFDEENASLVEQEWVPARQMNAGELYALLSMQLGDQAREALVEAVRSGLDEALRERGVGMEPSEDEKRIILANWYQGCFESAAV